MTDFETRLREALVDGVGDAPSGTGLADAARSRARRRRRTTLAGVAAAVVLAAVAVPVGLATLGGDDTAAPVVVDPNRPAGDGWRTETWHQATIRVPSGWGHGYLSDWCGGRRIPRVVERPEGNVPTRGCLPQVSSYGVSFRAAGKDAYDAPQQVSDGSVPEGAWSGEQTVAGVRVFVVTPTEAMAQRILDSMKVVGNVDPNGCRLALGFPAEVPETGMAVCRYDPESLLAQSERLSDDDAAAAWQAILDAPVKDAAHGGGGCFFEVTTRTTTITLTGQQGTATATFDAGCVGGARVVIRSGVRELTPDVLRWALSPGYDDGPFRAVRAR